MRRRDRVRMLFATAAIVGSLAAGPGGARAQAPFEEERFVARARALLSTYALGAAHRFRRATSFGPFVGLGPGAALDPWADDLRISIGIGLRRFAIPSLLDA